MLPATLCLLQALTAGLTEDLSGVYEYSAAPELARTCNVAGAYFEDKPLLLDRDGRFYLSPIARGFWRREENRLILMNDRHFMVQTTVPDALLKQRYPQSIFEGMVVEVKSRNELLLHRWGSEVGPFTFRRKPRQSTLQMVKDGISGVDYLHNSVLFTWEAEERFDDLLAIIRDPRHDSETKFWAGTEIRPGITPAQLDRLIRFLHDYQDPNVPEKDLRLIRVGLSLALLRMPDDSAFAAAFAMRKLSKIPPSTLLRSIAEHNRTNWLNFVDEQVNSPLEDQAAIAIGYAAQMGHKPALPRARQLAASFTPWGRVRGMAAVVRLSEDRQEKIDAMRKLKSYWGKATSQGGWTSDDIILEAWGTSGLREAVPLLVWVLESASEPQDRLSAAKHLGNLRFPEAVPALLNAKNDNDLSVQKAVADALWIFDEAARANSVTRVLRGEA